MFHYTIDGNVLDYVSEMEGLVDSKLSWNQHVNDIVNRANKTLGLIKRTLGYRTT